MSTPGVDVSNAQGYWAQSEGLLGVRVGVMNIISVCPVSVRVWGLPGGMTKFKRLGGAFISCREPGS